MSGTRSACSYGIPLVGEPAIGVEVAVVADEDDQRVVVHALRLQLVDQPAHRRVDFGDEAVVANHVGLITLGRVEPPVIADAPLVRFAREKRRQRSQELRIAERRWRHARPLVAGGAPVLGQVLLLGLVFGVGGEIPDAQQKRPLARTGAQEVERIQRILFGDVHALAARRRQPVAALIRAHEVEIARPRRTDVCTCRRSRSNIRRPAAGRDMSSRTLPGVSGFPNRSMPCRDMYCPVSSDARLVMQIDVVTRACVKWMPSDASRSRFGVRTMRLPAAPIESHRVSSMTRTTTFMGAAGCCRPPSGVARPTPRTRVITARRMLVMPRSCLIGDRWKAADEVPSEPARIPDDRPRSARQPARARPLSRAFSPCSSALYAVLFHLIKLHVEHEQHSWITGFYWTLVVMTTLGFGDITFTSDIGRLFSIVVLLSGVVFLLVMLPFLFIRLFYAPWLEARVRLRAPREVPAGNAAGT